MATVLRRDGRRSIVGESSADALNSTERWSDTSRNRLFLLGLELLENDAPDLGSGTARCGGSSPSSCTTQPPGAA